MNAYLGANADKQRGVLVVRDIGGDDFAVSKRHCLAILKLGGKRNKGICFELFRDYFRQRGESHNLLRIGSL